MHTLYQINTISFQTLLEKDGNSPTYIKNNIWKYYYVLTYVLNKRRYTTLKSGWVKVSTQRLKHELGNSKMAGKNCWFVDRIRKDLKRWNIILSKYKNNVGSNGTRTRTSLAKVLDEVALRGWSEWVPNRAITLKQTSAPITGVYASIRRSLSLVNIDFPAALGYAEDAKAAGMSLPNKLRGWWLETNRVVNEEVHSSWTSAINAIQRGQYEVHVEFGSSGRVYTFITNFPKALKSFLSINGMSLWQLDCANSQPLLFALYLKRHYTVLTSDMQHYLELVQNGEFYSYIKNLLTFYRLKFDEATFKGEFFAKIFFSREKVFGRWRTLFHHFFPAVSAAILEVKGAIPYRVAGDPRRLSAQLSLLESEIMIDGVARRLYEQNLYGFVTVHDAILTTQDDGMVAVVYNMMLEEYANYGLRPKINLESLKLNEIHGYNM
ncbi:hypothetical protein [Hymenobacter siberiensis]|uniref:hypothetical protein n=1 Tax=Hymenobacter siberiensis TaxID=2848396 RepID=UPI001C1E4940|nr:hypothetical protein [Hymenobacter siberiensis]MBU6122602.1 hypothetical protein [Hymenobacter siberiensis]